MKHEEMDVVLKAIKKFDEEVHRLIDVNTLKSDKSPVKEAVEKVQQDLILKSDLKMALTIARSKLYDEMYKGLKSIPFIEEGEE